MSIATKRQLLAVLAADIAGYTRLMESGEEDTHRRFTALMDGIVRPTLAAHGGRMVKSTGDGFLATFESTGAATTCALQIQERVAGNPANDNGPLLLFRMGLNLADVIVEQHDVFGDGVNLAARLQGLAEPGGLVVSAGVAEHLAERLRLPLVDLGEVSLKHMRRPARAFAIGTQRPPPLPEPELPELPSIAVLPFRGLAGGAEEDWFAEGLIEGIVSVLAGIEGLFVIAAATTHAYAGRAVDPRQVGRELGVRYLLTGSALRSGSRLRIATELCDATTGAVLRTDRHDGAATDLFEMQDRISTHVVAMLAPSVQEHELQRAMRKHPDSMTGYDWLLRALDVMHRTERESFDRARGLLQQAIATNPGWAAPRSHAAFWTMVRINQGWSPDPAADFAEAVKLADSALARDANDAVALSIQALMVCFTRRDYATAALLSERALAAGPNCALAWGIASFVRGYRGEWQAGLEAGHRALRLSPMAPLASFYEHAISQAHFIGGEYPAAVEWGRRAEARNPGFTSNQRVLIAALVATGAIAEARTRAARLLELDPNFRLAGFAARSSLSGEILDRFIGLLRSAGLPG